MLRDYLRKASKMLGRNVASEEDRFKIALRVLLRAIKRRPKHYHRTMSSITSSSVYSMERTFATEWLNKGDRNAVEPKGPHRNQFRLIFSDKLSILNGRTVDISTCRQHDRRGLKHPPRRRKAKKKSITATAIKALTIGSLKASMARIGGLDADERNNIASQIRGTVVVLNRLRRYAY
ncbi:hypothetical protein BCR41DRAFT_393218 [Lobosporangium transversale]|uniref:Uncharacterized protein n=1 Tax=Lobosporangium transversale TaxID=64571 RepID=A0A1Y2GYP8_9FUNG|nr:hypothetical protein BCR41DRAFT_393218 [Lobosporangium transversale]ORZ26603.1 hypothetical protein BCR41DRAFT_393218 [Lobosporangium transversale]|eukprot:XP_021884366.1 hypothetical protein BCR41DRAFT_393218 [Lobosporangium transversale]